MGVKVSRQQITQDKEIKSWSIIITLLSIWSVWKRPSLLPKQVYGRVFDRNGIPRLPAVALKR